jgi:hypothetical protein
MLKEFVGCRINNDPRRICDACGMALLGGRPMGGSGLTDRHESMNVLVKCEIYHLFTRFLSAAGRRHIEPGVRERRGMIPKLTRYLDAQPGSQCKIRQRQATGIAASCVRGLKLRVEGAHER